MLISDFLHLCMKVGFNIYYIFAKELIKAHVKILQ